MSRVPTPSPLPPYRYPCPKGQGYNTPQVRKQQRKYLIGRVGPAVGLLQSLLYLLRRAGGSLLGGLLDVVIRVELGLRHVTSECE